MSSADWSLRRAATTISSATGQSSETFDRYIHRSGHLDDVEDVEDVEDVAGSKQHGDVCGKLDWVTMHLAAVDLSADARQTSLKGLAFERLSNIESSRSASVDMDKSDTDTIKPGGWSDEEAMYVDDDCTRGNLDERLW